MEDGGRGLRSPRYPAEDTSPTTERELRGFFCYGLAAEVFAVCAVGSFLPVTLEQLAREQGVLFTDKTTSCTAKNVTQVVNATANALLKRAGEPDTHQCIVNIFGTELTTASFAMYTFSFSVFMQALALVSVSSVADHGNWRKKLLAGFGFTGSVSAMLFLLVVPQIFIVGSLLTVICVVCLGCSFVILNSYLPLLVLNHPTVASTATHSNGASSSIALEPLSPNDGQVESRDSIRKRPFRNLDVDSKADSTDLQLSTRISAKGVGIGYMAAVSVQVICIIILYVMNKVNMPSTIPLRTVLFFVGSWWLTFTIPSIMWLRDRPGPPLPTAVYEGGASIRTCLSYTAFAWKSLWKTVKVAVKLRQVLLFLVAWFLLSDAVATISATAILFARTELQMGTVSVAILSIVATASGIGGATAWPILAKKFSLKTNQVIVCCLLLLELVPLYGLLGYVPFVQAWGVGGLQRPFEIYPLGIVHGVVMGGLSSYCRSFYGRLIPPGSEAAFYALFAITDKGSSAVGPAIVGRIVDATGQIRPAFGFLAVLIALPIPMIWMVDVNKGQEDAIRMAGLMKTTDDGQEDFELFDDESSDGHEAEGLMRNHG
ncbi:MFS transporter family protein [Rutstroemia sp. NJR-2017a BBW]|nr:MFS transporter family protein [Rutstroemia sp. NJR-2017a BBW]